MTWYDGSMQAIERIPQELKEKYATAFEVEPAGCRRPAGGKNGLIRHSH